MDFAFTLLILAALGSHPNADAPSHSAAHAPAEEVAHEVWAAKTIFSCDFEEQTDLDFDGWPDTWTRQQGRGYPDFLKIELAAESAVGGAASPEKAGQHLKIDLNGGGAAILSAPITINPLFSFVLNGRIKTDGLHHDAARITLTFLDTAGSVLETHESAAIVKSSPWQTVRVGPLTPQATGACRAMVTLQVRPEGRREDLSGSVCFDDLQLQRLPRMTLRSSSETGLYTSPPEAKVVCEVAGIAAKNLELLFELFDHDGRKVAEKREILRARPQAADAMPLAQHEDHAQHSDHREPEKTSARNSDVFFGQATWQPPLPDFGFYRVRVSLGTALSARQTQQSPAVLERSVTLAAIRPLPAPASGEFGWSLAAADKPLPLGTMATLLSQSGVNWVKLPMWFSEGDTATADRIAWFAERLSLAGIQMVGVLDQPPPQLRDVFREKGRLPMASIFIEPDLWQPVIDPVMTRLSLKVRWWQLGDDSDTSFVGFPQAAEKIAEVKQHFERFGQETRVGITWRWLHEPPAVKSAPWAFLSYRSDPDLTAAELADHLRTPPSAPVAKVARTPSHLLGAAKSPAKATPPKPAAQRWLVLSPLPRGEYALETRAGDLVARMLTAKIQGADAMFVPHCIDDDRGLVNTDGTPGELLLPWRTTALLLAGAEYLGQLQLPGGSTNHVFARDGRAFMMIWNDQPTTETVTLGEELRQLDLWGRETTPAAVSGSDVPQQKIAVGTLPSFVTGLDEQLARWQISFAFESPHLDSLFGRPQMLRLVMRNASPQSLGGELRLHAPKCWGELQPIRFKIAEQDELRQEVLVTLQTDANSGPQPVRIDFDLTADRNYRFSVYRTLQLGLSDVQLDVSTRLRDDGSLVVEQHLTNTTDQALSFQATLFAPDRRRETKQILHLGRGRTTLSFVLPRGEELLGQKIWLRCEELTGSRVLNHTVVAER